MLGRRREAVAAYERVVSQAPDSDAAKEAGKYLSRPYRRD
jgi:hypothetical protein